jgi:hypothetical protein
LIIVETRHLLFRLKLEKIVLEIVISLLAVESIANKYMVFEKLG